MQRDLDQIGPGDRTWRRIADRHAIVQLFRMVAQRNMGGDPALGKDTGKASQNVAALRAIHAHDRQGSASDRGRRRNDRVELGHDSGWFTATGRGMIATRL